MLVKDQSVQDRHAKTDPIKKHQEEVKQSLLTELKTTEDVSAFDAGNPERQRGRQMWPHELETLIRKLLPGEDQVHFLNHPKDKTKKCIYLKGDDGNHWYVGAYENGLMPERSIMEVVEERIPNPDATIKTPKEIYFDNGGEIVHIPKGSTVSFMERGKTQDAFKTKKSYGRELVRGWRSVLLMLLYRNIISLEDIERAFGYTDNQVWAAKAKKHRDAKSPF